MVKHEKGRISMWYFIGFLFLPTIIFYTVRAAVEEGTFNALIKYERYKEKHKVDN